MRGLQGYESVANKGMPFSLTLLLLPLSLHQETRVAMQSGKVSYLSKILDKHPEILVGLPARVQGLLPYTFEAFGLLMNLGAISVSEGGEISVTPKSIKVSITGTDETRQCQLVSRSIGKKFATVNDKATIYTSLGIRP